MSVFNIFKKAKDIAINVGPVWTTIVYQDKVITNVPSVVAMKGEKAVATGIRALEMEDDTPDGVRVIHPMKDGVINDFNATEQLVKNLLANAFGHCSLFGQRFNMIWVIPPSMTEVERNAIRDIASHLGDRSVRMVLAPLAATIGIGKNVNSPEGRLIIDVGATTTDISIVSLGGLVCCKTILADWQKDNTRCFEKIGDAVNEVLEQTPPELRDDIEGAALIGDGAYLKGLDTYLQQRIGIGFHIAREPELAAVKGAEVALRYEEEGHYYFLIR